MDSSFERNYMKEQEIRRAVKPGSWRMLSAAMGLKNLPIHPPGPGHPKLHGSLCSMAGCWKGWLRYTAGTGNLCQINI